MDMVAATKTLPYEGQVFLNGHTMIDHKKGFPKKVNTQDPKIVALQRVVGYVEQTDKANGES